MSSAFFLPDGDAVVPTAAARGPWGESVSGNYVGGLLGHLVELTPVTRAAIAVDCAGPIGGATATALANPGFTPPRR